MITDLLGMRLATFADLGKELGVSRNQIYMWNQRRQNNGFPEPVMHGRAGNGYGDAPWFDLDEVVAWRATYVPLKGGYQKDEPGRDRDRAVE